MEVVQGVVHVLGISVFTPARYVSRNGLAIGALDYSMANEKIASLLGLGVFLCWSLHHVLNVVPIRCFYMENELDARQA